MSHPYGVARTQRGERTTSASGIQASAACAHQLDDPEEHREAGAEDDGAVEVRPDDEQRQHEQGASAGAVPRRVDEEPERGREAGEGRRLRAERPAPGPARIARKPTTNVERDEAPPARAVANARPSARRTKRDPEQDHGAHPGEPVGGVEDDLGEPLLVGPGASLAEDGEVLGVREAVLDHLAPGHQREPRVADDDRRREDREEDDPDQADEEDREGARLQDAGDPTGVRLQSDT